MRHFKTKGLPHLGVAASSHSAPARPGGPACRPPECQEGSAIIEFVFLTVLLMIPVAYLVLTLGQLQGGAYAVVGAADQAAKVFVAQKDEASARAAAGTAVAMAVQDLGFTPEQAHLDISCDGDCMTPGSTVHTRVTLTVPLPVAAAIPGVDLNAATVDSSASQLVGRFR